jgi:LEA14-like dessication related protein
MRSGIHFAYQMRLMKRIQIVFVVAVLLVGCGPKEQVILRAINIKEVQAASTNPLLKADAIFFNPNSGRMRVKRIDIEVFIDGKKAASVDQHLNTLIKGNSEFTVPLEIQLNLKEVGFLDTILSLFGGKKYDILFVGNMKVTVSGFPVNVPINHKDLLKL